MNFQLMEIRVAIYIIYMHAQSYIQAFNNKFKERRTFYGLHVNRTTKNDEKAFC